MNELGTQRERGELVLAACFGASAALGAWLNSGALTLFGTLGTLTAIVLYVWQRTCLVRLSYRRIVPATHVPHGDRIDVVVEIVNDKLLPLPWVRVEDAFPASLAHEVAGASGAGTLTQEFALLPFEIARRTITVSCDRRGRHRFGDVVLTSGDPLGIRPRSATLDDARELVVYPKTFALTMPPLFSHAPLGEQRARSVIADPTRVASMRPYRAGDPLRHIDWRATARRNELLVRSFESTTTLRLVIFVDCADDDVGEFSISLAASVALWSTELGVSTGIYATATADGEPVGSAPLSGPRAATRLCELLAVCEPGTPTIADAIDRGAASLTHAATAIVISPRFSSDLLAAMAGMRRRAFVVAITVDGPRSLPPPPGLADTHHVAAYDEDWRASHRVVVA